ncbi:hypothetical protein BCR42DRAFT_405061 [Absidia repens]|uniref:Peptidase S9 prolyl oligopeptidase catalytic domain-containing protein n=1 Tax=Absidia repens TaxID=90262 RepID=A0A1X2IYN7_9FUNG|nr:hypothetical protein BCR42DRAFT_405061 [Absidia repens]
MSFQLSTLWHDFGADPLEAYARFPSELSHTGDVGWTTVRSVDNVVGPIPFPDVEQNDIPFGWSIENYQVWCRGTLKITKQSSVLIQLHGVASFILTRNEKGTHLLETRLVHDVRVFGGGNNKQGPQCQFSITVHPLDYSSSSNGSSSSSSNSDATLLPDNTTAAAMATTLFSQRIRNHNNCINTMTATTLLGREMIKDILMPSFLHNIGFAGKHGALSIHNLTMDALQVVSIRLVFQAYYHTSDVLTVLRPAVLLQRSNHAMIVSGQQRRIGFSFDLSKNNNNEALFLKATKVHAKVIVSLATPSTTFTLVDDHTIIYSIDWNSNSNNNNNRSLSSSPIVSPVFSYTFLDFDGTVQYAKAKRPRTLDANENKPIILALHGAGVDVMKDSFWTNSIDTQESVWVVFPTGRTPWGMDWHGPSMKNAFCSLDGLVKVMDLLFSKSMEHHQQSSVDYGWVVGKLSTRLLISLIDDNLYSYSHSNGGQGAWYLATHYPDRAVAVVAAAGYVKIQDYVSYSNWISHSHIDPLLFGMLESAYAEYNNDLYLPNMIGLPILARYGSEDDNVPPLHTRKYIRLLNQHNNNPGLFKVSSVEGKGHWWDSVLNDKEVNTFLRTVTHSSGGDQSLCHGDSSLDQFTIVTTNPASTGPVRGIQIEQLTIPYRKSCLRGNIETDSSTLTLKSTNVSAFKIYNRQETTIIIDQTTFHHVKTHKNTLFVLDKDSNKWKIEEKKWPRRGERSRLSYGPIHRLYESCKPLLIVIPSNKHRQPSSTHATYHHLALQIAHDWYLYGGGDSMIVPDDHPMVTFEEIDMTVSVTSAAAAAARTAIRDEDDRSPSFFRIYLSVGKENQAITQLLSLEENHVDIELEKSRIQVGSRQFDGPGTGILFLCPGSSTNELAVVVSGLDLEGLELACQLLPKRTGMLVPEWVVTSPLTKEQGLGGILGAGFFDNEWQAFGY